ncbi:uncharacterized protein LOC123307284 [Coccinella septempunctata]|uniref:uncharacterized protein LOC123307284 n=1 Tax=Coccinella septempunctata TaxID=41139 RepID=UPI001D06AFAC|nr:uncharacterized protein LOC123307284 [Coccinella septempunctata]
MFRDNEDRTVRRAVRVRRRIKSLIRLAFFNAYWLEEYDPDALSSSVLKNVRVITTRKKIDSLINLQQKAILNKREEHRTESERRYLSVVLGGMRCFKRYPEKTRRHLARVGQFAYYPPGRTILREGDPPFAWYYILAGKVGVMQMKHTVDGLKVVEVESYYKGYTFGEFSMLHGTARNRSIVTTAHCEFLTIEKDAFNAIIRRTVMHHYNIITNYVKKLPYFQSFDQKELIEACLVAKVKEYEHDELVLGDDVGYPHYAYFVIRGNVRIIHHLMFTVQWDKVLKRNRYKLYDPFSDPKNDYFVKKLDKTDFAIKALDDEFSAKEYPWETHPPATDYFQLEMVKSLPPEIHTSFIKIYTVNELGCFNIGENLRNRFVIAEASPSTTICLLLPNYWLYKRNIAYIWSRLVSHFNLKIPNAQRILNEYVQRRQWEVKKRKLVKKILTGSHLLNSNTMHNVPYSLRMKEDLTLYKDAYSTFSTIRGACHR